VNQRPGDLHIRIAPSGDQQVGRVFIRVTIVRFESPFIMVRVYGKQLDPDEKTLDPEFPNFAHAILLDASCSQIHKTKKGLIPHPRQENISPHFT
jgi:hypothetical protein